jgi:hypothetical protein
MNPSRRTTVLTHAQRLTIRDQIGMGTVLSISGGRQKYLAEGISLPVSNGYSVDVTLDANDTYTVSRVYRRAGTETIKGSLSGVYCDQLSELAYRAGMFRSYSEFEWASE